jgi:hypothetical protein
MSETLAHQEKRTTRLENNASGGPENEEAAR